MLSHPIPPLYNHQSEILILGSFPSVKSREQLFFYGHPQNRFWKVVATIFQQEEPKTIEDKRRFLLQNHIALWDVIAACEIDGSADSTIRNVRPNDLTAILNNANIQQIYVNGKTAHRYYTKHIYPTLKQEALCLPSTSPANASFTLDKLIAAWSVIRRCKD